MFPTLEFQPGEDDLNKNAQILFNTLKAERAAHALKGYRLFFSQEEQASHPKANNRMLCSCWDFVRMARDEKRSYLEKPPRRWPNGWRLTCG